MRERTTNSRIGKVGVGVALGLALTAILSLAGEQTRAARIAPPNSMAFGKSLQQWLTLYWTWNYLGANPAQSVVNKVQLLPLPPATQIGGSWTVEDPAVLSGTLEITIHAGTPFVLPAMAWVGERYDPALGMTDDPVMSDAVFLAGLTPELTIDGKAVLSDANKAAFYIAPTYFDPIVTYPAPSSYGSIAAVFFQGVGFVSPPLAVGVHTIHLYESFIIPAGAYERFSGGLIYDNTWTITVVP